MRSNLCDDGKFRIFAKVVVPMGHREITMFALSNPKFHGPDGRYDEAMNDFENLNKRQLFDLAKKSVALRGSNLSLAINIVNQQWSPKQIDRAHEHVRRLFPEVD